MGGGGKNDKPDNPLGDVVERFAEQSDPLRKRLAQRYMGFLGYDPKFNAKGKRVGYQPSDTPGFDVTQMPTYWPMRNQTEDQYGVATEQLIGNMAPGGGLDRNLSNMAQSRARSISDIGGQLAGDEYNKVFNFATGAVQPAAALAGQQMQSNAMEGAGKSGGLGSLGSGIGMMIGMGLGGPPGAAAGGAAGGKAGKAGGGGGSQLYFGEDGW